MSESNFLLLASVTPRQIFIPSESCSVMFALASIRTPSGAKSESGGQRARSGEPFGEEAKAFSRQNLLQRTVEVRTASVFSHSSGGSFFSGHRSP